MEAAGSAKQSITTYKTTRCHEDKYHNMIRSTKPEKSQTSYFKQTRFFSVPGRPTLFRKVNFTPKHAMTSQKDGITTLPLTSALKGHRWSTPRPGRFTPAKDPIPIVKDAG